MAALPEEPPWGVGSEHKTESIKDIGTLLNNFRKKIGRLPRERAAHQLG
jgi:hypothetical protein